ncbi:MAG: winged helix-turn-helix transcriptional regulator [Candidatus Dormibacteraeota bacterium]|nr:winged helix-turn-helix transcriptional regulator [Candidatus Dormibacteraeota bacterium]MBO0762891.1 winged helix-turn-helix transcriptional regulator [Candidatus Dormibacteraeota bacterium]
MGGDADLAAVGRLLADPGRCRVLLALGDGRALPASGLAAEAGVRASTASEHLAKLVDAGLLCVETHGRHRYFRLAGPHVARVLEAVAQVAPAHPVRSLRQGTRAQQVRDARTCYDHLAGRLGVALLQSLIDLGHVCGGDGSFRPELAVHDRLAATGRGDVQYVLTDSGRALFADLGVQLPGEQRELRYCVDWSEQRHHLAGAAGRSLCSRLAELSWIRRSPATRAVTLTDAGRAGLAQHFHLDWRQ